MTIDIPEATVERAKQIAAERNTTISALITDSLDALTRNSSGVGNPRPLQLPVFNLGEANPAVDLDSNASIYSFFDEEQYGPTRR